MKIIKEGEDECGGGQGALALKRNLDLATGELFTQPRYRSPDNGPINSKYR